MVTATQQSTELKKQSSAPKPLSYIPMGEDKAVELTVTRVRKYLMQPTRNGKMPTDEDVVRFMMLCSARRLNPWVGDAYAVGYDTNDGPKFELITSIQSMFKRAELCPEFAGIESGVIVRAKQRGDIAPPIEHREGDFFDPDTETLLGGWAKVYRKDRDKVYFESVRLKTFQKGTPIWKNNPEGMISKVSEAGALRKAFPNALGGLYVSEEITQTESSGGDTGSEVADNLKQLSAELQDGVVDGTSKKVEPEERQATETKQEPAQDPDVGPVDEPEASEPQVEYQDEVIGGGEEQETSASPVYDRLLARIESADTPEAMTIAGMAIKREKNLSDSERSRLLKVLKSAREGV